MCMHLMVRTYFEYKINVPEWIENKYLCFFFIIKDIDNKKYLKYGISTIYGIVHENKIPCSFLFVRQKEYFMAYELCGI